MGVLKYMDEDYTGFGEMNVQSDWNQSDSTKDDYIKNKPSANTITPTSSSNKVTISDVSSTVRWGKIVCCTITVTLNGTFSYREEIASGFPKPVSEIYVRGVTAGSQVSAESFRVDVNGKLLISTATTHNNKGFAFSFSYVTSDD